MKFTLITAIQAIGLLLKINEQDITKIEYEDGSGQKFNFSFYAAGTHHAFIDFERRVCIPAGGKPVNF